MDIDLILEFFMRVAIFLLALGWFVVAVTASKEELDNATNQEDALPCVPVCVPDTKDSE